MAYFSYLSASWSSPLPYAANVMIRPLCVMLMFAVTARTALGPEVAAFFVIGSSAFAVPWVIRGGLLDGFQNERESATLGIHFTSNGGRLLPFLARGVLHGPNAVVAVGFSFLGAVLFLDYSLADVNWLAAAICLAAMIGSVVGLCLLLGTFTIVLRDTIFIGNSAMVFFLTLSGGYIPREDLPAVLRTVSEFLPMAHGIEGMREAFDGANPGAVADEVGAELLVGLALTAIGYALFRLFERYAIKTGRYELT
jgi:hypothetical protein